MAIDDPVTFQERIAQLRTLLWGTTDQLAADALERYIRSLERRTAPAPAAQESGSEEAPRPAIQPQKTEKRL